MGEERIVKPGHSYVKILYINHEDERRLGILKLRCGSFTPICSRIEVYSTFRR